VRADILAKNYKTTKSLSYENTIQIQDHFAPKGFKSVAMLFLPSSIRVHTSLVYGHETHPSFDVVF
jgi:hypothetical protein